MPMIEFDALNSVTQIISASTKGYIDIFKPEGTVFTPPLLYFYTDAKEGFFNLFIVETGATDPIYLPNWLSEVIQVLGNQQVSVIFMREAQEWAYEMLKIFKTLCQMRAALWWWLMFNPYQQPFNTLRVLTEWYLTAFTGVFPVLIGIDIGPTVGLALLGNGVDILGRLAFTMPYLPREGELFTPETIPFIKNDSLAEMFTEYGQNIRVFRNLPYLWYKYSIPDNMREDWYQNRPEITEHFIKNYYHLEMDFLPNRILKEFYEKSGSDSLNVSFHNVETISTNLICWVNNNALNGLINFDT